MGHWWDTQRQITTIKGNTLQYTEQVTSLIELFWFVYCGVL